MRNLNLNKFQNIKFENKAISNLDNEIITFNESENDWESSQSHSDFNLSSISKVNTLTIDTLVKKINIKNYNIIIKLDIEGAEMKALEGAFKLVESTSPLIIMEFSKYIFEINQKSHSLRIF